MTSPYSGSRDHDGYNHYSQQPYSGGKPGNFSEPSATGGIDAVSIFGDSFRYFGRNWAQWLFAPLVQMVVLFVAYLIIAVGFAAGGGSISLGVLGLLLLALAVVALLIVCLWATAIWCQAANKQVNGQDLIFGDFFTFKGMGGIMLAYLVTSVVIGIGFVLLVIPGLFALFFWWWVPAVKAARPDLGLGACFKLSTEIAKRNIGTTLLVGIALIILQMALGSTVVGFVVLPGLMALAPILFVRRNLGMRG
ncbi:hypothetical protein [Corynebacterium sp. KPL2734]|uniref:hypothetical protein n=1 Tax=Corynebacterium sp. KPL2734 TaxID=3158312 RepID=UPI0032F0655E